MEEIYFYSTRSQYGCLSNFSRHGFDLDNRHWKTSEHYFQAYKFADSPSHFDQVWRAPTSKEAARLGRDRNSPRRADWETVKEDVMRRALYAKFRQNPEIREVLLSTGDKKLVEETTGDYYWGCGTDRTGQNKLGLLLMEVRDTLRKENNNK